MPVTDTIPELHDLIRAIREDIPDRTPGDDPHLDGRAFSLKTLLNWINDGSDLLCHNANIIQDWFALPSVANNDVYELPTFVTSVEQVWYNLLPLTRSTTYDNLYTTKRSGSSWWFSPYSVHAVPRMYLYPATADDAASTALNGAITDVSTSLIVDSTAGFNQYGYVIVGNEWIRYAHILDSTTFTNLLRGQAGKRKPVAHADNDPIVEGNIVLKCFRLPRKLQTADAHFEVPRGLHGLIQLYVQAKVLIAEQDKAAGNQMLQTFFGLVEKLSQKPATQGVRQGIQVRTWGGGGMTDQRIYMP